VTTAATAGAAARRFAPALLALALACAAEAAAFELPRLYRSPHNGERPVRARTDYIVLHTTEGPAEGSLRKLTANGEAHYMLDSGGHLSRIIRNDKVAFHSGRSMWNGRVDLDSCSIGIEVVGYYNTAITDAQYKALRALLESLQKQYRIPDDRVLTHSMVAYSPPNKWFKRSHRGRKRCGMLFANPIVRQRLGLSSQPAVDPDVRAGRLIEADPYLAAKLYQRTLPAAPVRKLATQLVVEQMEDSGEGIRDIASAGVAASSVAGDDAAKPSTFYLFPNGAVKSGNAMTQELLSALPRGTKVLLGYVYGGKLSRERNAFSVCGRSWNFPSTMYRYPDGTIHSGSSVAEKSIPANAMVFYQK
jgi:N-acetylmuramoyl-L-alanine amidase